MPFSNVGLCKSAGCGVAKTCELQPDDLQPFPIDSVVCAAFFTSWFFNATSRRCQSFSYSACSPRGPFESKTACVTANCATKTVR